MTRKWNIIAVVSALALSATAPAFADSQLVASAGLTPEQAQGMSLTEIAQHKFNRDVSGADRWDPAIPVVQGTAYHGQLVANAGVAPDAARGMSLTELAAVKFNNDTRPDDHQTIAHASAATVATRSTSDTTKAVAQLIASAGLTPEEAEGMSLSEIAQYKFDRDVSGADRHTAYFK